MDTLSKQFTYHYAPPHTQTISPRPHAPLPTLAQFFSDLDYCQLDSVLVIFFLQIDQESESKFFFFFGGGWGVVARMGGGGGVNIMYK